MIFALHPCSWFDRQHTETQRCFHHVRLRESRSCQDCRQSALRLPRIGCKTQRNAAAGLEDAPHFSQPSHGVWHTCIELIARVLSKVWSSNGKRSTEPCRTSTRPLSMACTFRA